MATTYKRLPSKTIVLSGEVSEKSIMMCVEDIFEIIELKSEYEGLEDFEPIKLIMNSPGGSVYDGFALIGIMETSTIPIHTYAYGQIMSMALPIYVSGHVRWCSPYTTFMYHQIAWQAPYEKLQYHKQEANEGDRLHSMYNDVILKRTKIPKKTLNEVVHSKSEWYFGPEEAKKYKVVDNILK